MVVAACSSARASGGLACARLRVGGGVRQVDPGAELRAEALGLGAALDLRVNTHSFRPASMAVEHVDCQQQRALSRTGRFSSSSKSDSSHGGIVLAEAMGFSVVAVVKGCSCWGCCVHGQALLRPRRHDEFSKNPAPAGTGLDSPLCRRQQSYSYVIRRQK